VELEAATRSKRKAFDAFLVYSHRDGSRLAAILQNALETYPPVDGRTLRIFRDTTDLAASPSLMFNIQEMVDNSEFLILLASPAAAQSRWVEAELSYFLKSRSPDRVLMVIAAGDPESSTAPSFRSILGEDMPLFVDFRGLSEGSNVGRNPDFQMGVAKLVAGIRRVALDDIVDRAGSSKKVAHSCRVGCRHHSGINSVVGLFEVGLASVAALSCVGYSLHTPDARDEFWAQQPGIGRLIRQPSDRGDFSQSDDLPNTEPPTTFEASAS